MFSKLSCDLYRYFGQQSSLSRKIELIIFTPAIWAIAIYRVGNWVQMNMDNGFFRKLFMLPLKFLQLFLCYPMGIEISFNATIGKGLYIGHFGGIVVNSKAVIGSYCNLSQGVTIGEGGRAEQRGTPVIGDKVYIGAGAKIFGKIQVGDNAAIGANSVVPKSIPDNAVACGVPAKVINFKSSSAFIQNCDKASLGG